jgi:hypothetical protein
MVIEDRATVRQVPQQPADLAESEGMIGEERPPVRALSPQSGLPWIGLGLAGCDALSLCARCWPCTWERETGARSRWTFCRRSVRQP